MAKGHANEEEEEVTEEGMKDFLDKEGSNRGGRKRSMKKKRSSLRGRRSSWQQKNGVCINIPGFESVDVVIGILV